MGCAFKIEQIKKVKSLQREKDWWSAKICISINDLFILQVTFSLVLHNSNLQSVTYSLPDQLLQDVQSKMFSQIAARLHSSWKKNWNTLYLFLGIIVTLVMFVTIIMKKKLYRFVFPIFSYFAFILFSIHVRMQMICFFFVSRKRQVNSEWF